ncbi:hypothetical protein BJX76DRAFT_330253 [Aspergillus varians]
MSDTISDIRASKPVTPQAATDLYESLPAISSEDMIGDWVGTCVFTNHPGTALLLDARWVGKSFHSTEDVDPIVSDFGEGRVVNGSLGKARLREVKYHGVVSAAMIYNDKPIIDYFRRVDETTVMGVMDAVGLAAGEAGDHGFYFILEKLAGEKKQANI